MEKLLANHRQWLMWLGGAIVLGTIAVLFFFEPTQHAFYPVCIFHQVTGWQCPGCGGLRAMHQLLHGHLLAALHFNPLLILSLPFLGFALGRLVLRQFSGKPPVLGGIKPLWVKLFVVSIILFTILRNIPVAPFTYLSP